MKQVELFDTGRRDDEPRPKESVWRSPIDALFVSTEAQLEPNEEEEEDGDDRVLPTAHEGRRE